MHIPSSPSDLISSIGISSIPGLLFLPTFLGACFTSRSVKWVVRCHIYFPQTLRSLLDHMKLTAVKYYCSDLGNSPQRAFAIRVSMNRVIFFIYSES